MKTFEDYLQGKCFEKNTEVSKDDMESFYESWVIALDPQELINYADEALQEQRELTKKAIKETNIEHIEVCNTQDLLEKINNI